MWNFLLAFFFGSAVSSSRTGQRLMRPVLILFAIGVLIAGLIYACAVFRQSLKGVKLPMSTHTAPIEESLDAGASVAHRSDRQRSLCLPLCRAEGISPHYRLRNGICFWARCGLNFSLARRPIVNRYIRIDEMGRAQAIQYSDLNYSPREGEVRTYLMDWANYRYTISRDTIAKKYPLNYYFLSQALASQLMTEDNQNHLVSQVMAGQIEQSDVDVKDVTITSMSQETVQGAVMARGTALVALDRLYSPSHSHEPRTEHWMLSITYYLNPKQVSDQAKIYPQYEFINPLGLTITEFHENRISVDPIVPDTDGANQPATPQPATGAPR